ncbi:hypothetical protein [Salipiger marinus]|uniref:hypothetical protein n=1 Tax=Salipiger marinus TaxID=555512 RepID=UPI00405A0E87
MSSNHPTPNRAIPRQATSAVAHIAPEPAADDPLLGFAPYFHKAPRSNSITPTLQRRFIATLAATGIVTQAAMSIGKSMEALYKLRNKPGAEGFAAAWDAALERGVQRLEDTALARAIQGTPVWKSDGDGGILTYGTQHNEALVMFFLRNRRPERYSEHIRPGHPVYERIRAEVLAGLPLARATAAARGGEDTKECALSRHFAERLAREGDEGADDGTCANSADISALASSAQKP